MNLYAYFIPIVIQELLKICRKKEIQALILSKSCVSLANKVIDYSEKFLFIKKKNLF